MKGKKILLFLALALVSCSEGELSYDNYGIDYDYGRGLSHDMIVLGSKLENPYTTENITKALNSLYPTKAGRVEVEHSDLSAGRKRTYRSVGSTSTLPAFVG